MLLAILAEIAGVCLFVGLFMYGVYHAIQWARRRGQEKKPSTTEQENS